MDMAWQRNRNQNNRTTWNMEHHDLLLEYLPVSSGLLYWSTATGTRVLEYGLFAACTKLHAME